MPVYVIHATIYPQKNENYDTLGTFRERTIFNLALFFNQINLDNENEKEEVEGEWEWKVKLFKWYNQMTL